MSAKKTKSSNHKSQEKEHVPISNDKKRPRFRSSSKHSSSSKRRYRSRSHKSRNEECGTRDASHATAKEVLVEQRHKEETNPSVHDVQDEARSETSRSRRSKSRSPALITQLYLQVKKIRHSGPCSG